MLEIINQKNMNFLFVIARKPRNISELAKLGDLTLSVASTLISRLARENVVNKTQADGNRGREIIITLTEYGMAQVKLLKQIKKNYQENKKTLTEWIESVNPAIVSNPPKGCGITKIEKTEKGGEHGTE